MDFLTKAGHIHTSFAYGEITQAVLEGTGVGMLAEKSFGTLPFPNDWLDATESQRLL